MNPLNMFQSQWWSLLFKWIKNAYFTDLSAAGGMYYSIPTITLSGDFEIEFELYAQDSVPYDGMRILGDSAASSSFIKLFDSDVALANTLRYATATTNNNLVVTGIDRTKINTYTVVRISNQYSATYNGVSLGSTTISIVEDFIINRLAQGGDTNYVDGIIRNVRIWTGGDRTTGTLTRWYPLDERTGTVVRNLAGTLGAELITNGGFDTDSDWTKGTGWSISGGVASKTPGSATNLDQDVAMSNGSALINFDVAGRTAGGFTFRLVEAGVGSTDVQVINTNGSYEIVGNRDTWDRIRFAADSLFDGSIDNVSIREAPGYGSTVNITDNERDLFMQDPNGDWVNQFWPNLLTYSEEFNNAAWTNIGTVTVTPNQDTAPDGTITADKLVYGVNSSRIQTYTISGATTGMEFTFSVYVKLIAGTELTLQIIEKGGVAPIASFASTTFALTSDYVRYDVTGTVVQNDRTGIEVRLRDLTSGTEVFAWGAQLEEGSIATPYKRTTDVAGQKIEVA